MSDGLELESFLTMAVTKSLVGVEAQLETDAVAVNCLNKFVERITSN